MALPGGQKQRLAIACALASFINACCDGIIRIEDGHLEEV